MHASLDYMWDIEKIAKDHSDFEAQAARAMQIAEDYIKAKKEALLIVSE